jgi:hemerythrin-like domain-containing protein
LGEHTGADRRLLRGAGSSGRIARRCYVDPVKRAEALQPLSRDHHQALFVAQRLRRADDAAEAAGTFLEFWREHGRRHFRVEEEVLLPVWELLGTADPEAVARIAAEHMRIRTAAIEIEAADPPLERLHALGELLNDHVRFEERELFPRIEDDLDEDGLLQLAGAVTAAERG